jgi:hypothetical protein
MTNAKPQPAMIDEAGARDRRTVDAVRRLRPGITLPGAIVPGGTCEGDALGAG